MLAILLIGIFGVGAWVYLANYVAYQEFMREHERREAEARHRHLLHEMKKAK